MSLATRKSISDLQAEAARPTLRRALGPLNLTALGIGSVIGTGIFVLTGTAASQNAGPALVLSMPIGATSDVSRTAYRSPGASGSRAHCLPLALSRRVGADGIRTRLPDVRKRQGQMMAGQICTQRW